MNSHTWGHLDGARIGGHHVYVDKSARYGGVLRRHVYELAAEESTSSNAGANSATRVSGIRQQGRPARRIYYGDGGAGRESRDFCLRNRDGREESGRTQGSRQECQDT